MAALQGQVMQQMQRQQRPGRWMEGPFVTSEFQGTILMRRMLDPTFWLHLLVTGTFPRSSATIHTVGKISGARPWVLIYASTKWKQVNVAAAEPCLLPSLHSGCQAR